MQKKKIPKQSVWGSLFMKVQEQYYRPWREACEARQKNDENPPDDVQEYHRFRMEINERIDALWALYQGAGSRKFDRKMLKPTKKAKPSKRKP